MGGCTRELRRIPRGLAGITAVDLELGAHTIPVNADIPGLIDSALARHESRYAQALETAGTTRSGVPWIEPEDVALVVVFLASDEAKMVSGATHNVTGGDSAHYSA